MDWWQWCQVVCQGATQTQIAEWAGVSGPTVSRWAAGTGVDPGPAARLARARHRPVLEAFVAAGFLTATEAHQRPPAPAPDPPALTHLSDAELVEEVARRLGVAAGVARASRSGGRRVTERRTKGGLVARGLEVDPSQERSAAAERGSLNVRF